MKRLIVLILVLVFIALTFIGGMYVLSNKGMVSAGYAVVPSVLAVASLSLYMNVRNKN